MKHPSIAEQHKRFEPAQAFRRGTFAAVLSVMATLAQAQDAAPLSGIDWLKQALIGGGSAAASAEPTAPKRPIPIGTPPQVTVAPLSQEMGQTFGLLPEEISGIPSDLWQNSRESALITQLERFDWPSLPALQSLALRAFLSETNAPAFPQEPNGTAWIIARANTLTRVGGVLQAQALLNAAPEIDTSLAEPRLTQALYTGESGTACAALPPNAHMALPLPMRLYCQMLEGDWDAAALSLAAAEHLDVMPPDTLTLLWAFLDPSLAEDLHDAPLQTLHPSPLNTALARDIGLPLDTTQLPIAFALSDLDGQNGWKAQVEAALRLAQQGLLPDNQLLAILTERRPAASGRLWDNLAAWQALDRALMRQNPQAVSAALPEAWDAADALGILAPFARIYGADLRALPLKSDVGRLQTRALLLSTSFAEAAPALLGQDPETRALRAIATGTPIAIAGLPARTQAIAEGLSANTSSNESNRLLTQGRKGEALLAAITAVEAGWWGDHARLTQGLATLIDLGLEQDARLIALQTLLLEPNL